MKLNFYVRSISLLALTVCSYAALADDRPTPEQMEAVHACMANAGVGPSTHVVEGDDGSKKKISMNEEHKEIVDNCFRENGLEPPAKRIKHSGGEVVQYD